MRKRIESKKTAVFELEPDGFSIHTFELSMKLRKKQYHQMKDTLYRIQEQPGEKQWIYQEEKGRHCCIHFRKYGIRTIMLEHNQGQKDANTCFVRMIINPRVLIEPGCSYLGILPPRESSVEKLRKAFKKLFDGTVFDNDIENYYISRLDLCTNIRCDNNKLFRELVRVLRKLPTPPKYERKFYKDSDKKKANRYNKHYLRFCCDTQELIIYDKTFQIRDGNLKITYEKLPEGVLRFEVHCKRKYIQKVEKKSASESPAKVLWAMIEESEDRIINHFSRCFSDTEFVQMEELKERIKKSAYRGKTKGAMLELAAQLRRIQSVDKALEKLEKQGYDTNGLMDKFDKLGISPIPLWKNFCAKSLPGPVGLLCAVSEGKVQVEYVKVKHK